MPAGSRLFMKVVIADMEMRRYDIKLLFGTLCIRLTSEVPLILTDEIKVFCTDQSEADIYIYILN